MISRREEYRQEISFVAKNDDDPTSIHAPGVTLGLLGNGGLLGNDIYAGSPWQRSIAANLKVDQQVGISR